MSEMPPLPADAEVDIEELENVCKSALVTVLADAPWDGDRADTLASAVVEHALKALALAARPFKYVVTMTLQQRTGAGLHAAAAARWDASRDAVVKVAWENTALQALLVVAALALAPGTDAEASA